MSRGFSIVEVVIAAALFGIIGLAYSFSSMYNHTTAQFIQDRSAALALADEGLEATRSLRTSNFTNMANGTYGLSTSGSVWSFSGSSDTVGKFTRSITIANETANSKRITALVTWPVQGSTRSVSIETILTNDDVVQTMAQQLTVNTTGATTGAPANRTVTGITLTNTAPTTITIDTMTVSWSGTGRTISNIIINGTTVWSTVGPGTPTGSQGSGTLLDVQNFTLSVGATNLPMTMLFSGSMSSRSLTIVFTMSDASTKTVTVPAL